MEGKKDADEKKSAEEKKVEEVSNTETAKSRNATIDEVVDKWYADHIRGSAVSRNVEAGNHLRSKLNTLKMRLKRIG